MSTLSTKERLQQLPKEELERLYKRFAQPNNKQKAKQILEKRQVEEDYKVMVSSELGPDEYGGDPVGYVLGQSIADIIGDERTWFLAPEYDPIIQLREERLARIRADPRLLGPLRSYYRDNIIEFICDWGDTFDPRNVAKGLPTSMPFVLFKRQREWLEFVLHCWLAGIRGHTEKSRECGASWLAVALAVSLALFHDGFVAGFGSRKAEFVDKMGDPSSLFWKARMFASNLPLEFKGTFDPRKDAPEMRLRFANGSAVIGEGGDNIGRGGRTSIYFVDESAHLEHPELAEASLSQTTLCRQDISTPKGLGNPFEQLRHKLPPEQRFTFHWRDDPRKDDVWYEKQKREAFSPAIVAQEVDIDYAASVEGILIPHQWVLSAYDAHLKLGIEASGSRGGALDVADEGMDMLAFAICHGILVENVLEWSGKGSDIFDSVERTFRMCDEYGIVGFRYDSDGLGASVRGDSRVINTQRAKIGGNQKMATPFRGSEAVFSPEGQDVKGRKNKDFFANRKAQAWWHVREKFRRTHHWVEDGERCKPDEIISLANFALRDKLAAELSQPTIQINGAGKIVIEKAPDGVRSPNLADAVVIYFARGSHELRVTDATLTGAKVRGFHSASAPINGSGLHVTESVLHRARAYGTRL